jgi:hypothetical protein
MVKTMDSFIGFQYRPYYTVNQGTEENYGQVKLGEIEVLGPAQDEQDSELSSGERESDALNNDS